MGKYVSKGIVVTFGALDAKLLDVQGPNESGETVDVTDQQSTDDWRDFLPGLRDAGEATLTLLFDPDATIPSVGTEGTLTIAWPAGATKRYSCDAIVTSKGVAAPLGDKMTCDFGFKLTGVPDWAAAGS